MRKIIKNGKIILPNKVVENQFLIIEDDRIKEISDHFQENRDFEIIDAKNNYVSPGFIDSHIHGAGAGVFGTAGEKLFSKICDTLTSKGITTFLPTLMCNETEIKNIVSKINPNIGLSKRIAGIYIEGPFINPDKKGGINPKYIRKPNLDYLKKIIDLAEGHLKMMTIAPELEGIEEIIDHLLLHNIVPSFGHSTSSLENALNKKGAGNITHLFNAMSGISHKKAGLAALPFVDKNIFTEVNGDGIHIDNQIIKMCFEHINPEKIISITDAVVSAGLPFGDYIYDTDKAVTSSERGVRYKKNDVLIGSASLIPDILRNLKNIGIEPIHQLIGSVTLNPAKMLGIDDEIGSLEKGKKADIVIFDDNFAINRVLLS